MALLLAKVPKPGEEQQQQSQANEFSEEDRGAGSHKGCRVGPQTEGDGRAGDAQCQAWGAERKRPARAVSSCTAGTSGTSQDASLPHSTEGSSMLARGWAPGTNRTHWMQLGGTEA